MQHILTYITSNLSTATTVITSFPTSLYMTKKYLGFSDNVFDKYVICEKCGSSYTVNECLTTTTTDFKQKNAITLHIATILGNLVEILVLLI